MAYDPIPYASEQGIYFGLAGNLFRLSRELIRAIREFIRLIREIPRWPRFDCDVNRVSEQLPHDERVPEEDELYLSGGGSTWLIETCPNVTEGLGALGSAAPVRPEITITPGMD